MVVKYTGSLSPGQYFTVSQLYHIIFQDWWDNFTTKTGFRQIDPQVKVSQLR